MDEPAFLKQLFSTDDQPPKRKRKHSEPKSKPKAPTRRSPRETLGWDEYADIPDRGSFSPPTKESDFRKQLGSKVDEMPQRSPGVPPLTVGLQRPAPPAFLQDKKLDEGSKHVHVLGYDPRAYSIAFELAGCRFLDPVKLLIHKRIHMNNWELEGRRLTMRMNNQVFYRKHAEAEWVGKGKQTAGTGHIAQLIVTMPCVETKRAIENILHRIDNRTTICLIQDGLGVLEELNESFFQDPTKRPTYILGHMTASLGFIKETFYSSILKRPGKLFLTALERGIGQFSLIKFHPPVEARGAATSFLHTLATVPNLGAGAYPLETFLMQKLPAMVFNSVVEPLAIALDGTYEDVLRNETAMQLADDLLEELFNVIWGMPELTNGGKVIEHCGRAALRKYAVDRLFQKGRSQSQMLSRVRAGKAVDIDYLNGYFIKRGRELGIKMPQNEIMIDVVKARLEGRQMDIDGLIPMETPGSPQ